jgi:hypothetical protein
MHSTLYAPYTGKDAMLTEKYEKYSEHVKHPCLQCSEYLQSTLICLKVYKARLDQLV